MKQPYLIAIVIILYSMPEIGYSQKVYAESDYIVFDATGMNAKTYKTRLNDNTFASNGHVKRVANTHEYNNYISKKFRIAPTDIDTTGVANKTNIEKGSTWAPTGGWSYNANTLPISTVITPLDFGCPNYQGKDNDPLEKGKWRLPSIVELSMIWIYQQAMMAQANKAGLTYYEAMNTLPLDTSGISYYLWYASFTETSSTGKCLEMRWEDGVIKERNKNDVNTAINDWVKGSQNQSRRVRCISDVP